MEEMETKLRSKGCGNILSTNSPDDASNGDGSSAGGKQDSQKHSQGLDYLNHMEQVLLDAQLEGESITDFESRPHCTVPISFWYESFMPKLLEACSIGAPDQNILSEAALEQWFDEERARLERGKADDVLEGWKGCSTKVKLSIKRAWRLVSHYMLGPQKQRERDSESQADHRSTGDLTRYVAFLDVYLGRSYVEKKGMRVTFPYLIGPSTWNLHHLIAERASDPDLTSEMQSVLVTEFRDYFALFATMYPCPYCRHHFNEFVNRNKELNAYPMEFVVLGLDHAHANNRSHAFAFGDKLSAVTDGPSLRLFVWKLHNAVSASISRSESWYNEARSITTSRYWPNIHAEIYRGKTGSGAVSADRMLKIIKVVEVAADLEGLRKKYITNVTTVASETESEEKHGAEGGGHGDEWRISDVEGLLEEAAPLVRELDTTMVREGLLQESYGFHGHVDREFTVDDGGEMCRVYITPYMRNEHYTVR